MPDICLPVARAQYHGLYVELKRQGGSGRTSPEQRQWLADLTEQGYRAVVVAGWQAAQREILDYLRLRAHSQD